MNAILSQQQVQQQQIVRQIIDQQREQQQNGGAPLPLANITVSPASQPSLPSAAQPLMQQIEKKHPVSLLGELAAKHRWPVPQYTAVEEFGQPHQKQFLFQVNANGMNYTPAQLSNTKKEAKAVAARYALQQMGIL